MKPFDGMTDAEFYAECSDAAETMGSAILTVVRETARLIRRSDDHGGNGVGAILEFTMLPVLDTFGDLLNQLDAVDEKDEWVSKVFDEIHRRIVRPARSGG